MIKKFVFWVGLSIIVVSGLTVSAGVAMARTLLPPPVSRDRGPSTPEPISAALLAVGGGAVALKKFRNKK